MEQKVNYNARVTEICAAGGLSVPLANTHSSNSNRNKFLNQRIREWDN